MKVETQKVNDYYIIQHINVPFICCRDCDMVSIEENTIYGNAEIYMKTFDCANRDICKNFAKLIDYEE